MQKITASDEKENVTTSSQRSTAQKQSAKAPHDIKRYPLKDIRNVILNKVQTSRNNDLKEFEDFYPTFSKLSDTKYPA